jgi:hypothetical protein
MHYAKEAMRIAAALLAATLVLPIAGRAATTFSNDATDLWWNASESGWGANVVQQGDIVFNTLFVYGTDNKPTWFVGSALQATRDASGVTYSGDLFSTTGPAFSAATFDPNAVTHTKVGTATFQVANGTDGTLTYTANGARVVKLLTRQTWRENNPTGSYIGFLGGSCATAVNGVEESMTINMTQAPGTFSMSTTGISGVSCGYNGTYLQQGHVGHADGSFNCSNGRSGTFSLDGLEAGIDGFSAHLTTKVSSCTFTSRLGGIRRNGS